MERIRKIQALNRRELDLGLTDRGSWHEQFVDSAYVDVGGLSADLTEGDILAVLSQ